MSAALHHASPRVARTVPERPRRTSRAGIMLFIPALVALSQVAVMACEPVPSRRSEIQRDLDRAEEHRGWVELWAGLDDREARLELSLFVDRMRKVAATLAGDPCLGKPDEDVLRARVRHELAWSERKGSLLRDTVRMSRAGQ